MKRIFFLAIFFCRYIFNTFDFLSFDCVAKMGQMQHILFEKKSQSASALRKIFFSLIGFILILQGAKASNPVYPIDVECVDVSETNYFNYQGHQFQNDFLVFSKVIRYTNACICIIIIF